MSRANAHGVGRRLFQVCIDCTRRTTRFGDRAFRSSVVVAAVLSVSLSCSSSKNTVTGPTATEPAAAPSCTGYAMAGNQSLLGKLDGDQ